MASVEVGPPSRTGEPPGAPLAIQKGDHISVRWRRWMSIASGNSWSRPQPCAVDWFRRKGKLWLLGFTSPFDGKQATVISTIEGDRLPYSFFTGFNTARAEREIYRVKLGSVLEDKLNRRSMTESQKIVHDREVRHTIEAQVTGVWLSLPELIDMLDEPRRNIATITEQLVAENILIARRRAISGRGRPAVEFTRNIDD